MSDIPSALPPTTDPLDVDGGRALVAAWQASGLSGAAFCRQHNLRPQRLHYWRERLGLPMRIVGGGRSSMAPTTDATPPSDGFVQVVMRDPMPPATTYVDIVVGAATVRVTSGFDGDLLRSVVDALGGARRC